MALPRLGNARARALAPVPALLVAVGLLAGRPAFAQITTLEEAPEIIETEEPLPAVVVGVSLLGSFNTYSMRALNRALELMNEDITQPGVKFDRFSRGASMGGALRVILKERIIVEAGWERVLSAETIGGTSTNELDLSSNAYMFTLGWDMMKKRRVGFGPAVGVGYYDTIGKQVILETPVGEDERTVGQLDLAGNTLGMHVGVMFETAITGHVWANAFMGYRNAKISDLEIGGFRELSQRFNGTGILPQTRAIATPLASCADCPPNEDDPYPKYPSSIPEDAVITMQGGGDSLDYTGFMGKLAVTWYFNVPVF